MSFLADRMKEVAPSPTLAISALSASLRAQGKDVVGFGAGEPDFDTPDEIKEAAIEALRRGETKYTAVSGILPLRKAISEKLKKDHNLDYTPEEIVITNGGKQALYNFFMAVINPGDEVIIPSPYWVSYRDMVVLAGGKPVFISTGVEQNFKFTAEELRSAITKRTKAFVLNSPNNPTGIAYSREELATLAQVLEEHPHVLVVSDDIYEKLLYDGKSFYNLAMVSREIFPRTVIVNGFSKAYSMTGWRLGYAACKERQIIEAMDTIQGQSTSNVTTFAQYGALKALGCDTSFIDQMKHHFVERRDYLLKELSQIKGMRIAKPDGAFYIFPDISGLLQSPGFERLQRENPEEKDMGKLFCTHLLQDYLVAAVPGSAFGYEPAFRISYATSLDQIKKGVERLQECVDKLWS
ncbi:MAG: pyridoxal phosphate-dependent aminotransferase [Leptospiraceae bacterium]|nr:pyridoxal phosphate-dependent aminotransferase [Leptospiraceae bacterium]MDW8306362.1 pyridoxal phosphate-dependent aminotransferase [Leptospiraceae bacterium]